ERQTSQHEGIDEARPQHGEHGLAVGARVAEIALQRLQRPGEVALEQWLVEAVDRLQPRHVGRRHLGIARDHEVDGIARHQADQQVDHEAHQREGDRRLHGPAGEVAGHAPRRFSSPAFTAGHSVSMIEKKTESRTWPSAMIMCLRWMPSWVAPSLAMAARLLALRMSVLYSTRLNFSASKACCIRSNLHSGLTGPDHTEGSYQVEPISSFLCASSMLR